MNEIITCPACQRQVQLPHEFIGRTVQCPECKHAFVAGGAPSTAVSTDPAPPPPAPLPAEPRPRPGRFRQTDVEEEDPFDEWGYRRAAQRADRGGMVLAFGIISIMMPCAGPFLGPIAWFIGGSDLAAMDRGEMATNNRSMVQAGRIIGLVGFIWGLLNYVGTIAYFGFIMMMIGG